MTPRSQVERLAWLLCPRDDPRKLLMFAAYFDDSGTHTNSRVRAFAGYAGPADEWDRFEAKWRELLEDAGVPWFRAYDCRTGTGIFAETPKADLPRYYARAIRAITEHDLLGVATLGRHQDGRGTWVPRRASDEYQHIRSVYGDVVQEGMKWLGEHFVRKWAGHRLSLVIEQGDAADEAQEWSAYLHLKQTWPPYSAIFEGSPTFRDKLSFPQLQAADLLAHEMAIEDVRRYFNPTGAPERREWKQLQEHAVAGGGGIQLLVHWSPRHAWTPDP
jgi:hypothetical protein